MKVLCLLAVAAATAAWADGLPTGWFAGGMSISRYEARRDLRGAEGQPALVLRSVQTVGSNDWANISSSFAAERYRGKRIRYSARVRSTDVDGWGGLWMRVDGKRAGEQAPQLAFDNMQTRAIRRTTEWTRYEIVLDVAPTAETIYFGFLLNSGGTLTMSQPNIETVGNNVPVTGRSLVVPDEPLLDLSR
jgi:hypothetical protein